MAFWQRIVFVLATGYIFFFYSERMFWSFMRPDEGIGVLVATWLVYSIAAYLTLIVIERYRVRSVAALFVVGAVFGWIVEGVYAMTFFGTGGIPFPITIVWTSLAWHALISVLIGWYYLHVSLASRSFVHTLGLSAGLGLFWGVWSVAWAFEADPLFATPVAFFTHAASLTVFLAASLWVAGKVGSRAFVTTMWERRVLVAVPVLYTLAITLPAVSVFLPELLLVFAIAFIALRKNKAAEPEGSMLSVFEIPAPTYKYLCLFIMPIVATAVYTGLNAAGLIFPSNIPTFILTSVFGTGLFFWSLYVLWCRSSVVNV